MTVAFDCHLAFCACGCRLLPSLAEFRTGSLVPYWGLMCYYFRLCFLNTLSCVVCSQFCFDCGHLLALMFAGCVLTGTTYFGCCGAPTGPTVFVFGYFSYCEICYQFLLVGVYLGNICIWFYVFHLS